MTDDPEDPDRLDPRRVVAQGYDQIASAYLEWAQAGGDLGREKMTRFVLENLPPQARLLDLGCGAGLPTTWRLAQRFSVTGVDLSTRQIALAHQNVPGARFVQADLSRVAFAPASFDAVTAFYSIIHVPRGEYAGLFQRISSWLRPGGLFAASLGTRPAQDSYEDDFLGVRMYWSTYDPPTQRRMLEAAGFEIVSDELITQMEFGQPVTFQWLIARKVDSAPPGTVELR